jgi:methionyl-tRNA formyltransferase
MSKALRIVFMGTPEFATASLRALVENNYHVVAVVTAPDKPAGRGKQIQQSDVKKYALEKGIPVLQPLKLKAPEFLDELSSYKADLQVVVAFRMLPDEVWSMPPRGTLNLHASLLPDYRGAAPINRAIMNGETESGVTTFFIEKEIDTGHIIFREKVSIAPNMNAGELHDNLMELGSKLVLRTVDAIEQNNYPQIPQQELIVSGHELKTAPKIFKEDCLLNWNNGTQSLYNQVRGLSPYPAAYMLFNNFQGELIIKVYEAQPIFQNHQYSPGTWFTDRKTFLHIVTSDGFLSINSLQQAGRNRISVSEFLRGFQAFPENTVFIAPEV